MSSPDVRLDSARGRWVIAATALGSGIAFLDGTVVNVALPKISGDLDASLAGMQWVVNSYLVALSALLLLGGALGDRFGRRRVYVVGLTTFTLASAGCAAAPTTGWLVGARALQGVGGALLVPGSLAIIGAVFHPDDRGRAIGAWSGLAGVATSLGPFLGGWLIDSVSWRLIFLINLPLAAVAAAIAVRHVPETKSAQAARLDLPGAVLITAALALVSYAAIQHSGMTSLVCGVVGALGFVAFVLVERASSHPMLPLGLFRDGQFTGANATTFAVYAGLTGALFIVVLRLQYSLGYSALEAGAAFFPFTVLLLGLSTRAGALAQRIGARIPMTVGPVVAGIGVLLLAALEPGDGFAAGVLPGVVVFALGMSLTVAPLTAAVLASVPDAMTGVASGVNNAVSRVAGTLVVAALPALAGISASDDVAASLDAGYATALRISAGLMIGGGVIAWLLVRRTAPVTQVRHPAPAHACHDAHVAA